MAGVSRRGESGWDVDGWALVVARCSPLPGLGTAKVLCHNICVVIASMYELGIEPTFWTESAPVCG